MNKQTINAAIAYARELALREHEDTIVWANDGRTYVRLARDSVPPPRATMICRVAWRDDEGC
jgi:hypothetical protein